MKTLIVEDDFTSRLLMQELLKNYGRSHEAVNGNVAFFHWNWVIFPNQFRF